MVLFLALSVTAWFVYLSFKNPMRIFGLYFLLSNFFILKLPFINVTTSYLYVIPIMGLFGYYFFLQTKEKLYPEKSSLIFIFCICLAPFLVSGYHYLAWGEIPKLYLKDAIKAFWGLGFLFLPEMKINIRDIEKFLLYMAAVSAVLVAPESIDFYYKHDHSPLGRVITPNIEMAYQKISGLGGKYWFVMDDHTEENMAVSLPSVLLTYLWGFFSGNKKIYIWGTLASMFLLYVLYINQYFSQFIVLGFTFALYCSLFFLYPSSPFPRKDVLKKILILFFVPFCITLYEITNGDLVRLYKSRFEFSLEKSDHYRSHTRLSVYAQTMMEYINAHPLKGVGYVRDHEVSETPSGTPVTGHSTILDFIMAFGPFIGFMALLLYFYPFLLMLSRSFWHLPFRELLFFLGFFSAAFYFAIMSKYGRFAIQQGIYIGMTSLLIRRMQSLKKSS